MYLYDLMGRHVLAGKPKSLHPELMLLRCGVQPGIITCVACRETALEGTASGSKNEHVMPKASLPIRRISLWFMFTSSTYEQ